MALSAVLSKEMAIIIGTEGAELVPALATPNWTLGAGWAYGTSPATISKTTDGTGTATPASMTTVASSVYRVDINCASVTGTINWTLGGTSGTAITAAGLTSQYIITTTDADLIFTPALTSARVVLDSISVKLVTNETLGFATDFDFEINKETIDITTFDSAGWKAYMVNMKEWKVSFSGLLTRGTSGAGQISYDEVLDSMIDADTIFTVAIKTTTTGDQYFIGRGYITSMKMSGSVGDKITYSGEVQGKETLGLLSNA